MIYGYARVSTNKQAMKGNSLQDQYNVLRGAGATKIFKEKFTGTKKSRPELEKMMSKVKSGDEVVVTKLDRIARNVKDGIEIIESLISKGCVVRVMNMGVFDDSPTGRLIRNVMLAFAEFERDMIVQRTHEGKEIARLKPGYVEGRPEIKIDFKKAYDKLESGMTIVEMCKDLGISRSLWYKKLKEKEVA